MSLEFESFPKIPRLGKGWAVSEKIDGTNAQILIQKVDGDYDLYYTQEQLDKVVARVGDLFFWAGSRNRFIVPGDDNFAFALWVQENAEELAKFGPGRHYGEWFGEGIQKNPLGVVGKRLAMFNPRWADQGPACVEVAPQLGIANDPEELNRIYDDLHGRSYVEGAGELHPAAAEGIIAYHLGSGQLYKATYEFTEGKWQG